MDTYSLNTVDVFSNTNHAAVALPKSLLFSTPGTASRPTPTCTPLIIHITIKYDARLVIK
jgi:hypothetical protein